MTTRSDFGARDPSLRDRRHRRTWSETVELIRSDISFRCEYEFKPFTWKIALRMLRHPGVATVVRYRAQCFFYANGLAPLGWLMKSINFAFYGVLIHEAAEIGPGLFIAHAVSILITENVKIGERCALFHQNTIGLSPILGKSRTSRVVTIGNDVTFGAGSCAYGDIVIGDRCLIGTNAVVDKSFPPNSSIFGVPASFIGNRPARTQVGAGDAHRD